MSGDENPRVMADTPLSAGDGQTVDAGRQVTCRGCLHTLPDHDPACPDAPDAPDAPEVETGVLIDALTSIATKRQEADDWDHPDFDWRLLAMKQEAIARAALGKSDAGVAP